MSIVIGCWVCFLPFPNFLHTIFLASKGSHVVVSCVILWHLCKSALPALLVTYGGGEEDTQCQVG